MLNLWSLKIFFSLEGSFQAQWEKYKLFKNIKLWYLIKKSAW